MTATLSTGRETGLPIRPERVKTAQACAITGMTPRRLQLAAKAGKVPGAAKMFGVLTFDEATLRAWVKERVEETCKTAPQIPAAPPISPPPEPPAVERPRGTRSGVARRFTGASASRESSPGGRYEQAMSKLLAPGSRKTSRR